ncbi:MAG: hypothetical protein KC621_10175 [Myxococcales bacterium]|nr:hypothetical protein [Myxococcales bacterium]
MLAIVSLLFGCSIPAAPAAPRSAHAFPKGPLARYCPFRPPPHQMIPEAWYDQTVQRLERLDEEELRKRVCTTAARQEVAIGVTILAMRSGEDELLREIGQSWGEPLALAVWSERRSSVHHDPYAYRASLAAALIADGMERRSGTMPATVLRHIPMSSIPVMLDDTDRQWVVDQRSRYIEIFTQERKSAYVAKN